MSRWVIVVMVCLLTAAYGCEQKKETPAGGGKAGVEDVKKDAAEMTPESTPEKPAAKGDANAQATAVLKEIAGHLEGVTSAETAKAAYAKLEPLATKLDGAMAEVKKMLSNTGSASLTGMGQGLAEGLKGALGGSLKGAVDKVMAEIKRIGGNEDLLAPLKPVIEKIKAAVNV